MTTIEDKLISQGFALVKKSTAGRSGSIYNDPNVVYVSKRGEFLLNRILINSVGHPGAFKFYTKNKQLVFVPTDKGAPDSYVVQYSKLGVALRICAKKITKDNKLGVADRLVCYPIFTSNGAIYMDLKVTPKIIE